MTLTETFNETCPRQESEYCTIREIRVFLKSVTSTPNEPLELPKSILLTLEDISSCSLLCNEKAGLLSSISMQTPEEIEVFLRKLEQLKCIEVYKFIESMHANNDIRWSGAMNAWVEQGFAEDFARVYKNNIPNNVLYERVMQEHGQHP